MKSGKRHSQVEAKSLNKKHLFILASSICIACIGMVTPQLIVAADSPPADKSKAVVPTAQTERATARAEKTAATNQEEQEEIVAPKNFGHSSTVVSKSSCKIKCLDPHAFTEESAALVNLEQKIYLAYSDRDIDFISKHLADDCITFYEGDQKVVAGKKAALDDIKEWMNRDEKTDSPMLEIVIEHPYCNINIKDGSATVIFTALKEIGGVHPGKFKSHVTDVFKKDGESWALLNHYRSSWREIN